MDLLHQVGSDQLESLTLRVDRGFVVETAVLEMEGEAAGDAIAGRCLIELAFCDCGPIQRPQEQEAVHDALRLPRRHGLCRGGVSAASEQQRPAQNRDACAS